MNEQKYFELLQLYVWGELEGDEKIIVENKMLESDEYRAEYENMKQLYAALQQKNPVHVNDEVLQDARDRLMEAVRAEERKINYLEKAVNFLSSLFMPNYKYAFGSLAMLLFGLFAGYLIFKPASAVNEFAPYSKSVNLDDFNKQGINVSNIKIENPFSMDGDIQISFDAVRPITYRGKADDQNIRNLLAAALVNSDNAGDRIRTLNALKVQEEEKIIVDPVIKQALVTALKTDANPAVRRESLSLLMKYPFDNEIRDAYLFVLSNDNNSGLRVLAINALSNLKLEGEPIDEKIKNELYKHAESDDNSFIRLRAANLLKGDE